MRAIVLKADGTVPVTDADRRLLADVGAELVDRACPTERELLEHGAHADALMTVSEPITARVIAGLSRCRIISRFGIGLDNVDVEAASAAGIPVSNVPDFCLDEVSDHALALVLALSRRLLPLDASVRSGRWDTIGVGGPVRRLRTQALGLVGFGRIARAVAVRARAFGMRVVYVSQRPAVGLPSHLADARPVTFHQALAEADVLSLHTPLTPQTRHLIGAHALARMKPTAFLVNTARGGLVDETALAEALDAGREAEGRERFADGGVVQVAGHLVAEVAHEVVLVALLPDGRLVEEHAPALLPRHALRDEAAPDVRHAERAVGRQVEEREGVRPPRRVLAVEGAPRVAPERDAAVAPERLGQLRDEAVDGVHVRVLVGEPLLDGAVGVLDLQGLELRHALADSFEREAARPDVRVGEVAVGVDPARARGRGDGLEPPALAPELFARDVVVVGLGDEGRAVADGEQVAEVLAGRPRLFHI
jgi:D-3-phosphoglycerate dehydrogenase